MHDRALHARTALEQVCDVDRARELYATDFIDHVNALEFRGQDGIARSVAMYRADRLRQPHAAPRGRLAARLALAVRYASGRLPGA
jgi:hypothetical protein